jgi:hypothetical protein
LVPDSGVGNGNLEGLSLAEDCAEGFSDAGSLNSEDEQELADCLNEIEEENMAEENTKGLGEEWSTAVLAAIPEASLLMTGARTSKRRVLDSDGEVVLKAEKMKLFKNEGNNNFRTSLISFDNVPIVPNLEHLGISLGNDEGTSSQGLLELTRAVQTCSGEAKGFDKKMKLWT